MGFLSDFGRSNAYQVGNNLLGQVQQMGEMQVKGARQGFQETMAAGKFATEMQKSNLEINELKQKQEALFTPRNIRSSMLVLSLPEDQREPFVQSYIKGGYADESGMTNMFKRNQFLQESKEGVTVYFEGLKMKVAQGLETAIGKMEKAKVAGDADALAKAEREVRYFTAQDAAIHGKFKEAMEAMGIKGDAELGSTVYVAPDGTQVYDTKDRGLVVKTPDGKWVPFTGDASRLKKVGSQDAQAADQ
jgi:hypothetical protein